MKIKTFRGQPDRWWDSLIAVIAMAVVLTLAARINATGWLSDLEILTYLAFFAGLSGLALGYSRFSPLVTAVFSLVYGTFLSGWLIGTTLNPELTWYQRIVNVIGWRIRIGLAEFTSGQPGSDPILFLVLMALLLWILASSTTFLLVREGSAWPALVPLGITLLVIGHYDPNLPLNLRFLAQFIFLSLLIIGRMTFVHYHARWEQEGIHTTSEIRGTIVKAIMISAAALLTIAWVIPVQPDTAVDSSQLWERVTEAWDRLSDRVADIFVVETDPLDITAGFFDESMQLGRDISLSEEIVFTVSVDSQPPAGYRHYWRARSYDQYQNDFWATSLDLSEVNLQPDQFDLNEPAKPGSQLSRYSISVRREQKINLFYTGQPTWISRPATALTLSLEDGTEDLVSLSPEDSITPGETYQFVTLTGVPSAVELRETSTSYPEWLDPYLQLPEDFSPQIAALANRIAGNQTHPHDIAFTMSRYLRTNFDYSPTVPALPVGTDPIEWFLFEGKTGFCNYYATAQVLMLRSLGIPARLAVGFTQGDYNFQTATYTVRLKNSHAWPEVYFMDYGWVIYEPTASERDLFFSSRRTTFEEDSTRMMNDEIMMFGSVEEPDIIADDPPLDADDEPIVNGELDAPSFLSVSLRTWLVITAVTLVFLTAIILLLRYVIRKNNLESLPMLIAWVLEKLGITVPGWIRRWHYRTRMTVTEKAYRQLIRAIRILGQPVNTSATPIEQAQNLVNLMPKARNHAIDLIREYQFERFSHHRSNDIRARLAAKQLTRMAIKNRLEWIVTLGGRI